MKRYRYLLVFVFIMSVWPWGKLAQAQTGITIFDQGTTLAFPGEVTFKASIASGSQVQQIVLEYGVQKHTCGTVVAKAFPAFTPGNQVSVTWTWAMQKSGSEPPGATLWYRWQAMDQSGATATSETHTILWLDKHAWKQLSTDTLVLHYYAQSQAVGSDLLASAAESLDRLIGMTGIQPEQPIDIYIYGNAAALRNAMLYAPGWTGGLAFPAYDLLVIGIASNQMAWGKRALAHELTHVLIGTLTAGCFTNVPTWLNEGIAVYNEGKPDALAQFQLTGAAQSNQLDSIRVLSSPFAEEPTQANLSYTESYSLVNYLITAFSQDKLLTLFRQLRQGTGIKKALQQGYGFGLDELEQRWRKAIGAPTYLPPTATASGAVSTLIPTYQPADLNTLRLPPPTPDSAPSAATLLADTAAGMLVLGGIFYVIRRRRSQS